MKGFILCHNALFQSVKEKSEISFGHFIRNIQAKGQIEEAFRQTVEPSADGSGCFRRCGICSPIGTLCPSAHGARHVDLGGRHTAAGKHKAPEPAAFFAARPLDFIFKPFLFFHHPLPQLRHFVSCDPSPHGEQKALDGLQTDYIPFKTVRVLLAQPGHDESQMGVEFIQRAEAFNAPVRLFHALSVGEVSASRVSVVYHRPCND